jgi:hypothetical protein
MKTLAILMVLAAAAVCTARPTPAEPAQPQPDAATLTLQFDNSLKQVCVTHLNLSYQCTCAFDGCTKSASQVECMPRQHGAHIIPASFLNTHCVLYSTPTRSCAALRWQLCLLYSPCRSVRKRGKQ